MVTLAWDRSQKVVAIDSGGRLVGYALAVRHGALWEILVAVGPAWRRLGVGRALVDQVVPLAGTHEATPLFAFVADDDAAANAFFRALTGHEPTPCRGRRIYTIAPAPPT